MLKKIFECIFPMIANVNTNRKVREKISTPSENDSIFYNIENPEEISVDELKELYAETFKFKDKLEDKAKTNVIGVTISISLILGASSFLSNINSKFEIQWLHWVIFVLFMLSVIYMIIAGITAIKVLISENSVYTLTLSDRNSFEKYDECIVKNRLKNTIRNNYVYTSYECIRNSIVTLFVILIMTIIPVKNNYLDNQQSNLQQYDFVYSSECIEYTVTKNIKQGIETTIANALRDFEDIENDNLNGIIDREQKLFIQFVVLDKMIHIQEIKPYIN